MSLLASTPAHAGLVYALVERNNGNRIYGFNLNDATGQLAPIAGVSPFNTGANGVLESSFMNELLSFDRVNNRLYAVHRGARTIGAYAVNPASGALTSLPFHPISIPAAVGMPSTLSISPNGSILILGDAANSNSTVTSFVITNSAAMLAPGSPFIFSSSIFSSAFARNGNVLFTTGLGAFSVNSVSGALSLVPSAPAVSGWGLGLATDSSGRLFGSEYLLGTARVCTTSNGAITAIAAFPPSEIISPVTGIQAGELSPNEKFYSVSAPGSNYIGVFQINGSGGGSTMNLISGSPFSSPNGLFVNALVYNADGSILVGADSPAGTNLLTTWQANIGSGFLSNPITTPSGTLGTSGALRGLVFVPNAIEVARLFRDSFE